MEKIKNWKWKVASFGVVAAPLIERGIFSPSPFREIYILSSVPAGYLSSKLVETLQKDIPKKKLRKIA
jgi:hypothetical protein